MFQRALIATVILSFCAGMLAAETGALFAVAEEYNQEYRRLQLDRELTRLRLERQSIQSRDDLDRLQATDAALVARREYRRGLETFYHSVLDAAFAVPADEFRRDIAGLQAARASEQLRQVELRFQRGIVPRTEVIHAQIALRAALRDEEITRWSLEDSRIAFRDMFGRDWDYLVLPRIDSPDALPDALPGPPGAAEDLRDVWTDAHLGLARAGIAAEIARFRRDRLPGNAPLFDRRIADAEVERAEFELTRARSEAERQYEEITRMHRSQVQTILIRREEMDLQEELARESRRAFDRGLATSLDRDQAAIQHLQARIQLLNAELAYLRTGVTWMLALDGTPSGASPEPVR